MAGGCCDSMLKSITFLFNFLFLIVGCVIVGIGAYVQINMGQYFDFLGSTYLNAAIVFVIIGAVIVVVAFFGCCGACTESHCMLYTFGTLLSLILLVEIGVAVTVVVFKDDVKTIVSDAMTEGMDNYGRGDDYDGVTKTWDAIQHDFACCGVNSYKDWAGKLASHGGVDVPDSCCVVALTDCGIGQLSRPDKINERGCFRRFEEFTTARAGAVVGIGFAVALFQLIGVVVTCCLAKNMRDASNFV